MPVKKHTPAWPAAPETVAPHEERSNSTLLSVLAVIVTLAAVVGIFLVVNPPGTRGTEPLTTTPAASLSTSTKPSSVATAAIATSGIPEAAPSAPVSGTVGETVTAPSSAVSANVASVASLADERKSPDSVVQGTETGQQAASASSSSVAAAPASVQPVAAPAQVAFAPSAPATRLAAGTLVTTLPDGSIRNLAVVIDGRPYECFGQLAHLACDLKQ
jgi:hypothetical protein